MTIGERIHQLRMEKGLSRLALKEISGVSESAIKQYENGSRNPQVEQLQKIATALEVDVTWLVSGQTQRERDHAMKDYVADRFDAVNEKLDERLTEAYTALNTKGQRKAVEYVEDMARIPDYKKQSPHSFEITLPTK